MGRPGRDRPGPGGRTVVAVGFSAPAAGRSRSGSSHQDRLVMLLTERWSLITAAALLTVSWTLEL